MLTIIGKNNTASLISYLQGLIIPLTSLRTDMCLFLLFKMWRWLKIPCKLEILETK